MAAADWRMLSGPAWKHEDKVMAKFIFAYHGGKIPETEEEGARVMAQWQAWLGGMGAAALDPGNPVGPSSTVHPDGSVTCDGGGNPLSGYSLIGADSIEQATELARGCPILEAGGTVEIAEVVEM